MVPSTEPLVIWIILVIFGMETDSRQATTLKVKKSTRDRLANLCKKGETFDEAILKLLNVYSSHEIPQDEVIVND